MSFTTEDFGSDIGEIFSAAFPDGLRAFRLTIGQNASTEGGSGIVSPLVVMLGARDPVELGIRRNSRAARR